ncbi:DUF1819 family protein [Marinilactibacillus sp. Marseille-P9653]|uniref:DUF1819 family protein n=1 Tax=Marinilactibacillus sp. Marseille-P9653 TaxID=2866583 RepID=UPI001CE46A89|nr:DUF1819 family protein [Marinilactibacillus sp. Marseille-P9653]
MSPNSYSTTLNTRNFLYPQSKAVAQLMLEGKTKEEIIYQVIDKNLFQLKSKSRTKGFLNEILKRLTYLDEELLHDFLNTDPLTSKAVLFYALLKRDRLLFEWARELIWEKRRVLEWDLQRRETEVFLEKKAEQSQKVASWNAETNGRLVNALHQVLIESGYGEKIEEHILLQIPYIEPKISERLKKLQDDKAVEIVLGEVRYASSD